MESFVRVEKLFLLIKAIFFKINKLCGSPRILFVHIQKELTVRLLEKIWEQK